MQVSTPQKGFFDTLFFFGHPVLSEKENPEIL